MAVRRWLFTKADAANVAIQEANDTEIANHHSTYSEYVYATGGQGTILTVVGSGGNLTGLPMTDTRYQAGASTSRIDRFATEAETPNISVVAVNYSRISQSIYSAGVPADTGNLSWPLYLDGSNNLRAMNSTDFYDTFVAPALAQISGSTAGDYFISTASTVPGATLVSATPVFTDTQAAAGAYTAGGIGEAQDQPTTINNYYLHQDVSIATPADTGNLPLYIDPNDEQIKQHSVESFRNLLAPWLRFYTAQSGSINSYSINGLGTAMGSAMINTILSPTGTGYTQLFVNANDYRTQEFPNGTPVTWGTYQLNKTTI